MLQQLECSFSVFVSSLEKKEWPKSSFACEQGLFELNFLPFCLCKATATFHKAINKPISFIRQRRWGMVITLLRWSCLLLKKNKFNHLVQLREIAHCVKADRVQCVSVKCFFSQTDTKYLKTTSIPEKMILYNLAVK